VETGSTAIEVTHVSWSATRAEGELLLLAFVGNAVDETLEDRVLGEEVLVRLDDLVEDHMVTTPLVTFTANQALVRVRTLP